MPIDDEFLHILGVVDDQPLPQLSRDFLPAGHGAPREPDGVEELRKVPLSLIVQQKLGGWQQDVESGRVQPPHVIEVGEIREAAGGHKDQTGVLLRPTRVAGGPILDCHLREGVEEGPLDEALEVVGGVAAVDGGPQDQYVGLVYRRSSNDYGNKIPFFIKRWAVCGSTFVS